MSFRRLPTSVAVTIAILAGPAAFAQGVVTNENGIVLGRWMLSAFASASQGVDSNIFRRSDDDPRGIQSDRITTLRAGAQASVPFRQSMFSLAYAITDLNYQDTERLDPDPQQDFGAEFNLYFSSGDVLDVNESFSYGIQDVQRVDPGGELVFDGRPFTILDHRLEMSRRVEGRRGYTARFTRTEFFYDEDVVSVGNFFDYDTVAWGLEYREPISPRAWLEAIYEGDRSDQFFEEGELRQQKSDKLLAGVRGELGKGNPFFARVGYEYFRYVDQATGQFRGLVGSGEWRKTLGVGSLALGYNRRSLPSAIESTSFVSSQFLLKFEQERPTGIGYGAEVRRIDNDYADPLDWDATCDFDVPDSECPGAFKREDRIWQARAWIDFRLRSTLGVRFQYVRLARNSNVLQADYTSNALSAAVVIGWLSR